MYYKMISKVFDAWLGASFVKSGTLGKRIGRNGNVGALR